jgi:hypothetical protein
VLLIACANVANLLLVRGAARRKEFAVRAALGAGWRQTLRQLLMESLLLTGLGTLAGVLVAGWTRQFIAGLGPTTMIRLEEVRIDGSVLAFAALISVLATASYGLVPLLQTRRQSLAESLQDGGRGGGSGMRAGWLSSALVVAQVALALVLLIGAGLMIRSFRALAALDPFDELVELPVLGARLTLQHGDGDGTRVAPLRHAGETAEHLENGGMVDEPVQPAGRVTKPRKALLQVHVEAAKENGRVRGGGGFFEGKGQVEGQQKGVVAGGAKLLGQGVVAHADATVVASGAGGEKEQLHVAGTLV